MEGSPRHVVTDHFEVYELEQGSRLDVWWICLSIDSASSPRVARLTHVLAANLGPTFSQAVLYIFSLVSFVVSQASDEVVQRLLKPLGIISVALAHFLGVSSYMLATIREFGGEGVGVIRVWILRVEEVSGGSSGARGNGTSASCGLVTTMGPSRQDRSRGVFASPQF